MREFRPPQKLDLTPDKPCVFLAGSIELGKAVDWQAEVTNALRDLDVFVLNPRRESWDESWSLSIESAQFREQVEWELAGMEKADLVIFYFAPETKAPVTLLELGLNARRKAIVCCPDGYWRKGNVDVVCQWYGVPRVPTLEALIARTRDELHRPLTV